jgi:hypothetical protein
MNESDFAAPRSMNSDRITVKQAGKLLNTGEAYVQWLISDGRLAMRRDENDSRYLSQEEVLAYHQLEIHKYITPSPAAVLESAELAGADQVPAEGLSPEATRAITTSSNGTSRLPAQLQKRLAKTAKGPALPALPDQGVLL